MELIQVHAEPDVEDLDNQYMAVLREILIENCQRLSRQLGCVFTRSEVNDELIVLDIFESSDAGEARYQFLENTQLLLVDAHWLVLGGVCAWESLK